MVDYVTEYAITVYVTLLDMIKPVLSPLHLT